VDRWVGLVIAATEANGDPRTLARWARLAAVSESSLRLYCYTAGVRPKPSLDFARLARLLRRTGNGLWEPAFHLDVADLRTLQALLARGGFRLHGERRARTVSNLIGRQRLLPTAGPALTALEARLRVVDLSVFPSVSSAVPVLWHMPVRRIVRAQSRRA